MNLVGAALRNPINRAILQRLPLLGAPQAWLVAGCVYQVAWNEFSGRPPHHGIKDYDIFYFDESDLSWEAEDAVIRRGRVLFADLDGLIEIRNQARVHLWYPQSFSAPYPILSSAEDGIGRFLVRCT
ncbi:MAG: nucleotidyltransferase family protein, partial [Dongiaceae bacterium]